MFRRVAVVAMLLLVGTALSAHEVTYRGSVVAIDKNRYAASDGVLATIEIKVMPGGRTMTFDITAYTRIWRGETPVDFSGASIQPNEAITLTWVDEEPEKGAQEIRLSVSPGGGNSDDKFRQSSVRIVGRR